jgi:hypothetical protein
MSSQTNVQPVFETKAPPVSTIPIGSSVTEFQTEILRLKELKKKSIDDDNEEEEARVTQLIKELKIKIQATLKQSPPTSASTTGSSVTEFQTEILRLKELKKKSIDDEEEEARVTQLIKELKIKIKATLEQSPSTSASTSTSSSPFYTHKLPLPTDPYLIKKPFQRSARGSKTFRELNPSLFHTGPPSSCPPCNCNYIKSFASGHRFCDACHKDLGDARYAQEMHLMAIVKQEDSGVSTNDHASKIHGLGIRLSALIAFAYAHDCWDWPTWMIVRDIVKPATRDTRCRYADLPEMKDCFGYCFYESLLGCYIW